MADTKISALTDGTAPSGTDQFVVARAGANNSLTWTELLTAVKAVTLDLFAAPAASVAFNAKKITGLANGTAATDAAAYGQTVKGGALTGTSFPGGPATNDLYFRSDLGLLFYYDGTRWLTTQQFRASCINVAAAATITNASYVTIPQGLSTWVVSFIGAFYVASGNTGANFWTFTLNKTDTAAGLTSIASLSTSAAASATWTELSATVGASVDPASYVSFAITAAKTGSPGLIYGSADVVYRLIGT